MIAATVGSASNARISLHSIAISGPKAFPSVKWPQRLAVPRSTLQAWQAYHDSLDACPTVVAFFHSVPGLAFLHRLVLAIHLVCVEVGACGIRQVCLLFAAHGPQSLCRGLVWDAAPSQPAG